MSAQITSFTLSYTLLPPPSLCSCFCDFAGFLCCSFFVLLSLAALSCLSPFPPSHVRVLSGQLMNRLELLSSVDNRQLRSEALCGRQTSSYNSFSCEGGLWSFCRPLLMMRCLQKPSRCHTHCCKKHQERHTYKKILLE